jgi:putative acetyltransferase
MADIRRTDSNNIDFRALVALLDQDLAIRDGADHGFYAQFNKVDSIRNVVVCYVDDQPVACGAFKPYDEKKVEIKRMYVSPALRGQGIGGAVLKELEQWAAELNYKACVLETGKKQPEAIHLYQKSGYSIIKNYGQYENVENSVCMEKHLS